MAQCPHCGAEAAAGASACAACGTALPLPSLPFSPFAPPPAEAMVCPVPRVPLSRTQITAAVGVGVLFVLFVIFYVGRNLTTPHGVAQVPVLGHGSEVVTTGSTLWRVAYAAPPSGTPRRPPARGQYYLVGVLVGNKGAQAFTLTAHSLALADADTGARFHPVLVAWGTPDELRTGQYRAAYTVPPRAVVAGVVLFDIPRRTAHRQLLVRDAADPGEFAGAIALPRDLP